MTNKQTNTKKPRHNTNSHTQTVETSLKTQRESSFLRFYTQILSVRKRISKFSKTTICFLCGWCVVAVVSCLVPKRKNLVLFIGRNNGEFFDNQKYLYLYLHRLRNSNIEYYFLTKKRAVYNALKQNNLPVIIHPTLFSFYLLLRTHVVIVGSSDWASKYKYHFLFKSKKVQLWHGVPLKKIALIDPNITQYANSLTGTLYYMAKGKHRPYNLCICGSPFFVQNVFSKAFQSKHFLESGYPRNDILFKETLDKYEMLGTDEQTISEIHALKAKGYKTILYAPTFRDTSGDALSDGTINLKTLSEFANKYKLIFIFKLHLATAMANALKNHENIINYNKSKDIQPLLGMSDILITDYSSVYMDFLLLDRPIIFFPYDYDKYTKLDRELIFDYDWITPGPKCRSQQELHKAIELYLDNQHDAFTIKREEIRNLAFSHNDGNSSKRIWDYIEKKYLKL